MLDRFIFQPLIRGLRPFDREHRELVARAEDLQQRITEAGRRRAELESNIAQAEHELSAAATCEKVLSQHIEDAQRRTAEYEASAAQAKGELVTAAAREDDLRRQIAQLQENAGSWPNDVLRDDFLAGRVSPDRKHAWLVAAPKSGSTWLTNMLTHLLGWQPHMLAAVWDRREQEIDVRRMLEFPDRDLFSIQQHCRFSAPTGDFIHKFRVKIILQGRNLWDCVVSLRDHFLRESPITPVCFVDKPFHDLSPERQLDCVVDLATPWYLNFYASWFAARAAGEVEFHWIDYASLCGDTAGELRRIVAGLGLDRSDEQIRESMEKAAGAPTRKNVGRTGRGAELLGQQQKDRIAHLRSYYPQIDFSPIGLDAC